MGCSTSKETVTTGQQGHADYGGDYPFADKLYSSSVKVKDLLSWTEQRVLEVPQRPQRRGGVLAEARLQLGIILDKQRWRCVARGHVGEKSPVARPNPKNLPRFLQRRVVQAFELLQHAGGHVRGQLRRPDRALEL